ncbi:putative uncharacterized protein [Prevotella sp. CAG:1031]|nr:putative uncharacterized protein [Prevotella sp. CAG:1031]
MIRNILAIAGRPGLFKIVKQGKNMLIVSQLATGKCQPAYARDKVSSLGDISIYTVTDDKPLSEVFELIKAKNEGNKVDIKAIGGDSEIREYFAGILPEFDNDRVYTADIKKIFSWYNQLIDAGITDFTDSDEAEETKSEESSAD